MEPQETELDDWVLAEIQVRETMARDDHEEKLHMARIINRLDMRYRMTFRWMVGIAVWGAAGWWLLLWGWAQ